MVISALMALAHARPQTIDQIQFNLNQPLVPNVPGIAEHQAAVDALLALQGRQPGSNLHDAAVARLQQAEAELIALQQQQATAPAAPAATGVIGPSGIVGASGNIGPSGLCGPSGCVAF